MKPLFAIFMLLIATVGTARPLAADDTRDIRSALYCLTLQPNPMLSGVRDRSVTLNFARDNRSWVGERHLFLFVRQNGPGYEAFDIAISGHFFDIGNNATVEMRRNEVVFLNDPLGGVWTHDIFKQNFRKALSRRPFVTTNWASIRPRPKCRQPDFNR